MEWEIFLADMDWLLLPTSFKTLFYELGRWQRWLEKRRLDWRCVMPEHAHGWLHTILAERSHATASKRLWAMKRLYRWAQEAGHIHASPFEALALPICHCRRTTFFMPTEREVRHLLALPDTSTGTGIRDRAILELFYATGLRSSELLSLTVSGILEHFKHRAIKVRGKGMAERFVVYHETAQHWLTLYMHKVRPALLERAGAQEQPQFFVSHRNRTGKLSYCALSRMIRRYADSAGLPLLTAHSLRHAFATHMYCNGASLEFVQRLLGHSDIDTTAMYIQLSPEYLREQFRRYHPRGKGRRKQRSA